VPLAAPRGDDRVRDRQVREGEEPGALGDVADVRGLDVPEREAVLGEEIQTEEDCEIGLLLRALAVDVATQAFDLLVLRVLAAGERRRPLPAKLVRARQSEG
jgi:hypothetical protein